MILPKETVSLKNYEWLRNRHRSRPRTRESGKAQERDRQHSDCPRLSSDHLLSKVSRRISALRSCIEICVAVRNRISQSKLPRLDSPGQLERLFEAIALYGVRRITTGRMPTASTRRAGKTHHHRGLTLNLERISVSMTVAECQ